MTYKPGDIVTIPYPFSDLSGVKKRPALILVLVGKTELVCMMLSSKSHDSRYEYNIKDWSSAGLRRPTVARIGRLFTVDSSLIKSIVGTLNEDEFKTILDLVQNMFG